MKNEKSKEQHGNARAEYGKQLLITIGKEISREYGNNYSERNLRYYRQFYLLFPNSEIWNACVPNLNWTHMRSLLRVTDESARLW